MCVDFERHNGLAFRLWFLQSFTDFARILFLKNGLYYLVNYIWYIAFIESYYFLCDKSTIEQIYRNMCPLSRKLFVMAYLSLQNILFYQ